MEQGHLILMLYQQVIFISTILDVELCGVYCTGEKKKSEM